MIDKILAPINKFLDGKKGTIAGMALILGSLTTFLNMLSDGLQLNDIAILVKGLGAGLMVFGLGGKLQKLIEALS